MNRTTLTLSLQPMLKGKGENDKVSQLRVSDNQIGFVEPIADILKKLSSAVHGHVIQLDKNIIGFFLIDTSYSSNYEFCETGSIGLRSFFIDHRYQGHGYGKQVTQLLRDYLAPNYPNNHSVYLTVNCKNPAAKHCYEQGGFVDTQELYHGGDFGPQHILKLDLDEIQR